MATCISRSPEQTQALGESWGATAQLGCVIGLCGDLGAGKTQLVQGLARGLGISERVHSPTFALVNIYGGERLTLFHLDLYRLAGEEQIVAAGLDEFLRPAGVTVIEWAERWVLSVPSSPPEVPDKKATSQSPGFPVGGLSSGSVVSAKEHLQDLMHGSRGRLRWVEIEILNETERRITYEDFGV